MIYEKINNQGILKSIHDFAKVFCFSGCIVILSCSYRLIVCSKLPATPVCRDKFDLPLLQLAVVGKADFYDLLSLADQFVCPIITADQFMKTLKIE